MVKYFINIEGSEVALSSLSINKIHQNTAIVFKFKLNLFK